MEKISHHWNISIPLLQKILSILVPKDSDVSFVHEVKNAIRCDLEKRYQNEEVKRMLRIASFLDPRFKHLPFLTEKTSSQVRFLNLHNSLKKCKLQICPKKTEAYLLFPAAV